MKPLCDTESRDLFMKKAFGGSTSFNECPEELKKVGEEILKKCGGLPLAISVVGGLLAKKMPSGSEWEKVHQEMKSHLERSKDLNNISGILELSYQNLNPELKACFLCLAFFKEDATIKATKLVQIWVAHGLVPQEVKGEEARMEDVARGYLNELISRNMVQVKEMAYDVVKGCQVHDLLHDLSIRKADEEIDFEVLREESNSQIKRSLNKPRHRVYDGISFVYSTSRNQHLRSLYINLNDKYPYPSGGPSLSYWKSFELLRFLDLGIVLFEVLPKGIGELTGLKYLKMRYDGEISRLPRSWAKLKNLEFLDLRYSYGASVKFDKVIEKMESLRHLYANVIFSKGGLGNMRKLRTLHMIRVINNYSSNAWEIQGLSGVSKLGIDFFDSDGPKNNLITDLSSLPNLFHLILKGFKSSTDFQGLTSLHRVTRLKLGHYCITGQLMPAYFPPNLLHLTLSNLWKLEGVLMPVLEKLPNLLYLKIKHIGLLYDTGMTETTINGGFPKLKVLSLQNIYREAKIEIDEKAMPELNQFIISKCPKLDVENVPERIKSAIIIVHSH